MKVVNVAELTSDIFQIKKLLAEWLMSSQIKLAECPNCGCRWRDNGDDTISLADGSQKSCMTCEFLGWSALREIPHFCHCPIQVLMSIGCQCDGQ